MTNKTSSIQKSVQSHNSAFDEFRKAFIKPTKPVEKDNNEILISLIDNLQTAIDDPMIQDKLTAIDSNLSNLELKIHKLPQFLDEKSTISHYDSCVAVPTSLYQEQNKTILTL